MLIIHMLSAGIYTTWQTLCGVSKYPVIEAQYRCRHDNSIRDLCPEAHQTGLGSFKMLGPGYNVCISGTDVA